MATLLRTSKHIRCLNAFTQKILACHDKGNIGSKCLTVSVQSTAHLTKSYATQQVIKTKETDFQFTDLNTYLVKLKQDFQRTQRVRRNDLERVLAKVQDTGVISSMDGMFLLNCCNNVEDSSPAVRIQLVNDIWNTLEVLKMPFNVAHFNMLLGVYLDSDFNFNPEKILSKMKDVGIEPDKVTYQRLLVHNCKKGDIEAAMDILKMIKKDGFSLDETIFSALITGYSEANDMESAMNILNIMTESNITPGSTTYTALFSAYAKRGDIESIRKLYVECVKKNIYFSNGDLLEVVYQFTESGHDEYIDEIISLMPRGPTYNRQLQHTIIKLIDAGRVEVALKLFKTMALGRNKFGQVDRYGAFVVYKMLEAHFPIEHIIECCKRLEVEGDGSAFSLTVLRSLKRDDVEVSRKLLTAWKENGGEIREHYMWPMLVAHGKKINYRGILDVMHMMISEFKIQPGVETIASYILPYTVGQWQEVTADLESLKLSKDTIANAIVRRLLRENKIRKAMHYMLKTETNFDVRHFQSSLVSAFVRMEDPHSFAMILHHLALLNNASLDENVSNEGPAEGESRNLTENSATLNEAIVEDDNCTENIEASKNNPADDDYPMIDKIILQVLNVIPSHKFQLMNELLEKLVEYGISLSPKMGERLTQYFDENLTRSTQVCIEQLVSGNMKLVRSSGRVLFDYEKNPNSAGTANIEILNAIENNDADALIAKLTEFENAQFNLYTYMPTIDFLSKCKDVNNCVKVMERCLSHYGMNAIDRGTLMNYATLLTENNRCEELVELLNTAQESRKLMPRLLEIMSEHGHVEATKKLFEVAVVHDKVNNGKRYLKYLIKAHINNNDMQGALEEFEKIAQEYQCTPLKHTLSKGFIAAENADALQRISDLATTLYGESNALVDLALSFISCNRLRQARKILETPDLNLRPQKLAHILNFLHELNDSTSLLQFVEITRGLNIMNRQEFFEIAMEACNAKNDPDSGLQLWTEIQNENLVPSQSFMATLSHLLKRSGRKVPFLATGMEAESTPPMSVQFVIKRQELLKSFNEAITLGDLDTAERLLLDVRRNGSLYRYFNCELMKAYLKKKDNGNKLVSLVDGYVQVQQRQPSFMILQQIYDTVANTGDDQLLKQLETVLGEGTTSKLQNVRDFLREPIQNSIQALRAKLTNYLVNDRKLVSETMGSSAVLAKFHNDPESVEPFREFAEELAEKNIHNPIIGLWSYYFMQKDPAAETLFSQYIKGFPRFERSLLQWAELHNDVELVERLFYSIKDETILLKWSQIHSLRHILGAYTRLQRYDDMTKVLQSLSPDVIKLLKDTRKSEISQWSRILEAAGRSLPSSFQN